jgi:hypothetical protein
VQGLEFILDSPSDNGTLELIVRRPDVDERESLATGQLDTEQGLVGDNWIARDHDDKEMQLNIMNSRVASLVADDPDRRELAGDQLYLDMDLSYDNLPPGTRLSIGDAVIEVTEPPHTGCKKFAARFGVDAMVFVNSGMGRKRNFRGICARVIKSGDVKVGDIATKLAEG